MKRKAIVATSCSGLLVLIISTNIYLFSKALQPKTTYFTADTLFSDYSTTIFNNYVAQHSVLSQSATGLYDQLYQEIPVLKQLSIRYNGSQQAHIYGKALTPQAIITIDRHNYVLTENNKLFDAVYYNLLSIQKVPTLYATPQLLQENNTNAALQQFLHKAPQWLLDTYTIWWHNQTEIVLNHVTYKNFYMVTKYDMHYLPNLITAIGAVQKIVEENNKKTDWKADIRFNDQIILSPYQKKGGV